MDGDSTQTRRLLERARAGDETAFEKLLQRHRRRLLQALAPRLDRKFQARVDASDVVQETYLEASRRLGRYLQTQPLPFFTWLLWIAREKLNAIRRRHLGACKRAASREVPLLPEDTSARLVRSVLAQEPTPSEAVAGAELAERLRNALQMLEEDDRQLLLWRHFELLTNQETARLLGITEAASSMRHVRALERLRNILVRLGVVGPGP